MPNRKKNTRKNSENKISAKDKWQVLRVGAHQLRAPLSTISTQIKTILGGYVDFSSSQVKQLLEGIDRKTRDMMNMLNELMDLAQLSDAEKELSYEQVGLEREMGEIKEVLDAKARLKGVELNIKIESILPQVWAQRDSFRHVFFNLIENAVKYTPTGGRVEVWLNYSIPLRRLEGSISDTGIGIPAESKGNLFEEFYRAPNAKLEEREGTGLGLAIVKRIIESYKGTLEFESEVGKGTIFRFTMPMVQVTEEEKAKQPEKRKRKKIVIIGGRAAGPKAAARALRMDADADITVIERERFLSYAGCGLPYFLAGHVKDTRMLMTTPDGDLRDPEFFRRVKGIAVYNRTECLSIDKTKKEIEIKFLRDNEIRKLVYDKLILATGGRPIIPSIEGLNLKNVFTLNRIEDARGMRKALKDISGNNAVIVGGGLIGIESAEAIASCGLQVTIVEARDQVLSMLDPEIALLVQKHLNQHGVKILTDERVMRLVGENGAVTKVITNKRELPATIVIFGTGVAPETKLAVSAALEIGETGGIKVNEWLQTSEPDIYAIGDCVENRDIITGKPVLLPLGSVANRQGRVAGTNVILNSEAFPGIVETIVLKSFDYNIGCTGLNETDAIEAGFNPLSVVVTGSDKEHYYPSAKNIILKLIGDRDSGRILGLQAVGHGDISKRIDVAAALLSTKETIDALSKLDLGYAPPYSTPMDIVCIAANVYKNKFIGSFTGISALELKHKLDAKEETIIVDVRNQEELSQGMIPSALSIPLRSLRGRLHELPKDKEIVIYCSTGLSSYEASCILRSQGFDKVNILEGGFFAWPFEQEALL